MRLEIASLMLGSLSDWAIVLSFTTHFHRQTLFQFSPIITFFLTQFYSNTFCFHPKQINKTTKTQGNIECEKI